MDGLEHVFSEENQFYDRIFWEESTKQYYDRYTDIYLSLEDVKAFGL